MTTATGSASATEVTVPDIGEFTAVPVIEVHVHPGDKVNTDDPLVTLESDKATMDVPAPAAGTIAEVLVTVGDEVSQGTPILHLTPGEGAVTQPPSLVEQQEPAPTAPAQTAAAVGAPAQAPPAPTTTAPPAAPSPAPTTAPTTAPTPAPTPAPAAAPAPGVAPTTAPAGAHAGPSVRRLARELGIDLAQITPSGPKGRITRDDLRAFLAGPAQPAAGQPAQPTQPAAAQGAGIPPIPAVDFAKFGPVRRQRLSRIKKVSGPFLHRSWLNVPHVTHADEADITELDAYRRELDTAAKADRDPYRVTLLAFLVKAAVSTLKAFPEVNSSLAAEADELIIKDYYNIGIAVDTPDGLVVPVVRDADRKGIIELSREFGTLSARARDGKLSPADMAGGSFTISSLGGIGGTGFTPIVNAPEVAILGVVRSAMKPVWNGAEFIPRLLLPVSLSYDHRVVDGALAARFTRHLCGLLEDDRRLLL